MRKAQTTPRRLRLLKVFAGILALLALFAVGGPFVTAPFLRRLIIERIEGALNVRASLERVSFDLTGSGHAAGLSLEDLDGRPVLGEW